MSDNQVIRNDSFTISFKQLSYRLRSGLWWQANEKVILSDVSGVFGSGRLAIVLGSSGSGKTTLLDILSGFISENVQGQLLWNDKVRNEKEFRRNSCYIMHENCLQPLLTVWEAMTFAVNLKYNGCSDQLATIENNQKEKKVANLLRSMNLEECKHTRSDCLSGGQKKRLSIALELIKNPRIMLLDEPTSGLDSSLCKQCISMLKQLANEGRIVICSINQPSAKLLEQFDDLYALANGQCIYQGNVDRLLDYLSSNGLQCPIYHNIADFLVEITIVDEHSGHEQQQRRQIQQLVSGCKNGKIFIGTEPSSTNTNSLSNNNRRSNKTSQQSLYEFTILVRRTLKILSRDKSLTHLRLAAHLVIGLFIGLLYFRMGNDAQLVLDNVNYLFFSVMFLMITAFNSMVLTFSRDLPTIIKEHFNQWYTSRSYFFAIMIVDIPIQIFSTLLYTIPTYVLTGQPLELERLVQFTAITILVSLLSQSYGILIGISLSIRNAVIFGPLFFLPFTIFSGVFIRFGDAHRLFQWIFHISFVKYGLEGLALAVYGSNRSNLECNVDYCHYRIVRIILQQFNMDTANYWRCVSFLAFLFVIFRILTYFGLRKQLQNH